MAGRVFLVTRVAALAALLLLLCAAPTALAGWITINTNDGAAGNFGAPVYTSDCSDGSVADHVEIKNAWIANDGTNLYFKLEACGVTTNYNPVRYAAGLDCNSDGDADDASSGTFPGDRKAVYLPPTNQGGGDQVLLVDGANNIIYQLPNNSYSERIGTSAVFEWQMPLQHIYPECRASLSPIPVLLGTGLTSSSPPTKDLTPEYSWSIPLDYGDAINPDPEARTCTSYPTRLPCDGARHGTAGALKLGALVDPDGGSLHTANADGDDLSSLADEDGVWPTVGANWVAGGQGSLTMEVNGGSGFLNCWTDWNNDQDWADAGENILADASVVTGTAALTFTVPVSTTFPNTYMARCRLAPGAGQATTVTGAAEFGEVEDHQWVFGATGNRPVTVTVAAGITNTVDLRLSWADVASDEGYLVLSSAAPYFLPTDAGVTTAADPDNVSPFDVAGLIGGPPDMQFYMIQGQVTTSTPDLTSAPSNRVGLFEYTLIAGLE